jgi:hypothetical protein
MAKPSKFAGALAKLKKPSQTPGPVATTVPEAVVAEIPIVERRVKPAPAIERSRGRPPGKRSDPAYEPTTVLLRKDTKRAANRKLEDSGEKADLSVLIERLSEEWNARASTLAISRPASSRENSEQRGRASRLAPQFQDASRPHARRDVSFFGPDGVRVDRGGGELRMPEPALR